MPLDPVRAFVRMRRMSNFKAKRRRSRRRDNARVSARPADYRRLKHPFSPQSVFSEDEIEHIHRTALRVLEELGFKILLPEARGIFAKTGARIEEELVFIGRDIAEAALEDAPASFRLRAANPGREQIYEDGAMLFMPGAGCPNVTDFERGRRPGRLSDYEETVKLSQSFNVIHMFGPAVEPQDVPVHTRHYDMMRAQLAFGDKPTFTYARGRRQVEESFEMIRLALNLSEDDFTDGVWSTCVINTNSPRLLDRPMAQGVIDFARAGQMSVITPFCLAGAMAPATIAGALTLQHAEALGCVALAQLAKPGAPVSYGGFSSNVDMKSGAPAFGTPEHVKMQIGAGQLARRIGLPWRSASGSSSNTPDMQAANETVMSLWGALMANATLTVHAAGWLEGGLSFGYEKFINDIESLHAIAELCSRTACDEAEIGFSALQEVGPGGHFFGAAHTMERYQTAFHAPLVADLSNYGSWLEAGGKTSADRATSIWKSILNEFTPPETGAMAGQRLEEYIALKIEAGGAPPIE